MSSAGADLTARARIRNAALEEFAETGFTKATLRAVAARAGVSPALVPHHFGSKEGLRAACDEYLLAHLRTAKADAMARGRSPSPGEYLRTHPEFRLLYAYLRRILVSGGPTAEGVVDDLVADVASYLEVGEKAGSVRPSSDPEARAVVLTALSLGLMVFEDRVAAHLGGEDLLDPGVLARSTGAVMDLYNHGLFAVPFVLDDGPGREQDETPATAHSQEGS